jgi:hypothetical protein
MVSRALRTCAVTGKNHGFQLLNCPLRAKYAQHRTNRPRKLLHSQLFSDCLDEFKKVECDFMLFSAFFFDLIEILLIFLVHNTMQILLNIIHIVNFFFALHKK